ncbi:MAG TPA: TlpA disulfide reductase family protein [Candidatus Sulfotelmatobacter sp.]|nr:TlpA disulfide reductase family protein [Candidatus Sulfotelmatobacter sp.]
MPMSEKPDGTPEEPSQWCPQCGAVIKKSQGESEEPSREASAEGAPVTLCAACGQPLAAPLDRGNFPTNVMNLPPAPPPSRGRNPLALVVVALVAAGMLYFGFHMARRADADPGMSITKSGFAPDFALETLDGKDLRLSSLRGKAVLLNFWATWCGPCKIETPWLVELQKEYGAQGLQVVGVAMDDSGKEDIAKFAQEMGVNYPVLLGKEAVGDEYGGVPALPESFFIGRDGKIVDRIIGLRGRGDIEEAIRKALDTKPATAQGGSPAAALQAQK